MKIIGHIYEEENYDAFHRLPDNRDVLSNRLNKLIASISERYILNPICVNEKMEIIDGQGRFEARKSLNLPIHYFISAGATSEDCRRMNKYNTKWTHYDFAKSFSKAGVRAYSILLLACEKTGYTVTKVMRLANRSRSAKAEKQLMSNFERGILTFGENELGKVIAIKEAVDELCEALQFAGRLNDAFLTGTKIVIETKGYNHDHMLRNCKKCRSSFVQMAALKDQLVEFERIYNKGLGEKKLYFSDYLRNKGKNIRSYDNSYSVYDDKDVSSLKTLEDK